MMSIEMPASETPVLPPLVLRKHYRRILTFAALVPVYPVLAGVLVSLVKSERLQNRLADVVILSPSKVLDLSIDEGGNGGDGWAVDFLTVGVTTAAVPEPAGLSLLALTGCVLASRRRPRLRD